MDLIRINPTKMLVGGDQKKAKNFLGPARSQLEILKNQMTFQNLSQGVRKVWLNSDVYVECRKIFNYQECRVWVRPVAAEAIKADVGVYFYIHIVKPNEGATKGEDINRLILWRLREEEKTAAGAELSHPEIYYDDHGEYTDGRKWGIITPGAVILDVDLASDTVYTESGVDESGNPIEVDTTLTEEAQIEMAQKYIDVIYPVNPANNALLNVYGDVGNIYSPFESAEACYSPSVYDYVEVEPEIYFNESLDVDIGSGATDGFYHVRTEVEDPIGDPTPWCADPESEYNSIDWVDLDINAEKYIPTTQTNADGGWFDCGSSCFSTPSVWATEYNFTRWSIRPCSTEVSSVSGDHYAGNYFVDSNHPSFFVTLLGNYDTVTQRMMAVPEGYDQEYSMWPSAVASDSYGVSEAVTTMGEGAVTISTPLEQAIHIANVAELIDDLPDVQKSFYAWVGNRANAGLAYGEMIFAWVDPGTSEVKYEQHHPADWWGGYPDVSTLQKESIEFLSPRQAIFACNTADREKVFYSGVRLFAFQEANHVPLISYYECNHTGKIGHAFGFPTPWAYFYDAWPTDATTPAGIAASPNYCASSAALPTKNLFQIAVIFNLMQIESFTETDTAGDTTYWDIHTEREADQDDSAVDIKDKRDNHNREKILGAYVSAALKDIKQLPDFKEAGGAYKLLSDCGLSVSTGFVYQ